VFNKLLTYIVNWQSRPTVQPVITCIYRFKIYSSLVVMLVIVIGRCSIDWCRVDRAAGSSWRNKRTWVQMFLLLKNLTYVTVTEWHHFWFLYTLVIIC